MLRNLIQAFEFCAGCYQLPSLAQGSLFSTLSPPILSEKGICSNLFAHLCGQLLQQHCFWRLASSLSEPVGEERLPTLLQDLISSFAFL